MTDKWYLPKELEPYRSFLQMEGFPPIEELLTEYYNDIMLPARDMYRWSQAVTVSAQVNLLSELHRARMLRDLSAWVCKTPYPDSGNFCGSPGEHPVFWGCGFQHVK